MNTANVITIAAVLLLIAIIAFPLFKKMKSRENCCGNEKVKVKHKRLRTISGSYRLKIDGMHCKNCEKKVTEAINAFGGLSCRVSLEKKEAVVSYTDVPMTANVIKKLGDMGYLAEAAD